ncbi:unnamed protein product [Lepeophtheirus salmonis]|uniref:(salmon louse) hypothetical protein n=1 Tax=Lepeophtheirus salmonis TaxID=72036 RepID=A0A7R8D383_LEPSM|nr:unnamed protein product [Lepeophtheirus salmonis]CAF3014179.1 unnamed protein product [Lepeophtheirus salmonis]
MAPPLNSQVVKVPQSHQEKTTPLKFTETPVFLSNIGNESTTTDFLVGETNGHTHFFSNGTKSPPAFDLNQSTLTSLASSSTYQLITHRLCFLDQDHIIPTRNPTGVTPLLSLVDSEIPILSNMSHLSQNSSSLNESQHIISETTINESSLTTPQSNDFQNKTTNINNSSIVILGQESHGSSTISPHSDLHITILLNITTPSSKANITMDNLDETLSTTKKPNNDEMRVSASTIIKETSVTISAGKDTMTTPFFTPSINLSSTPTLESISMTTIHLFGNDTTPTTGPKVTSTVIKAASTTTAPTTTVAPTTTTTTTTVSSISSSTTSSTITTAPTTIPVSTTASTTTTVSTTTIASTISITTTIVSTTFSTTTSSTITTATTTMPVSTTAPTTTPVSTTAPTTTRVSTTAPTTTPVSTTTSTMLLVSTTTTVSSITFSTASSTTIIVSTASSTTIIGQNDWVTERACLGIDMQPESIVCSSMKMMQRPTGVDYMSMKRDGQRWRRRSAAGRRYQVEKQFRGSTALLGLLKQVLGQFWIHKFLLASSRTLLRAVAVFYPPLDYVWIRPTHPCTKKCRFINCVVSFRVCLGLKREMQEINNETGKSRNFDCSRGALLNGVPAEEIIKDPYRLSHVIPIFPRRVYKPEASLRKVSVSTHPLHKNNPTFLTQPTSNMMISTQQIAVLLSLFISVQGSLWQQSLEEGNTLECPSLDSIPDFDLEKFLGDWYVLQYQYPNEKKLKDLSCIGFHFAKNAFSADIVSNFTFRFPATTGHFYHIPTFSEIVNGNKAVWKTQIKGVEMISGILDTDYSKWAILTQCKVTPSGSTFSLYSSPLTIPLFEFCRTE